MRKLYKAIREHSIRKLGMTCYFRHLEDVFRKAGIEATAQNKREIDRIIHEIVGVDYKNCSATWKKVKTLINEDEAGFVSTLKNAWNNKI